jgi:hypothetical protein
MGVMDKLGFGKVNARVINAPIRLVGKGSWKDGKTTSSVVEFSDGTVISNCTYSDAIGTYLLDERAVRFLVSGRTIQSVLLNDGRVVEKPVHIGPVLTAIGILAVGIILSVLVIIIPFGVALIPFIMLYSLVQAFHAPKIARGHEAVLREFYQQN